MDPRFMIDEEIGFRLVPPGDGLRLTAALLDRCHQIIAAGTTVRGRRDKPQLNELVSVQALAEFPEFLDFALAGELLAPVVRYLDDFPILTRLSFWHSHASDQPLGNSQLYHCDHEDIRQMKVFVHVSDVDEDSGPLTVIPARISRAIRKQIGYTCDEKIPDSVIRPHIPAGSEQVLTGAAGTVAFVDTSQLLHFGSRVASKDRYVVVFQYVSLANFVLSPFTRFRCYPFGHLTRSTHSPLQRGVLRGVQ